VYFFIAIFLTFHCSFFNVLAHAKQILHVNKWSIPDILDKYSPVRTAARRSASRSPPAAAAAAAGSSASVTPPQTTRYCNVCAGNLPESEFTAHKVTIPGFPGI
jgi:hypothetical protein